MRIGKFLRRNMYALHRRLSIIVAIPLLLWSLSGFLHPVMSNFKPDVRNTALAPGIIDTARIKLSLRQALRMHHINEFAKVRIVKMYGASYYQLKLRGRDTLSYISCFNGQWLRLGDAQYAASLAQRFLSEPGGIQGEDHHGNQVSLAGLPKLPPTQSMTRKFNIDSVGFVRSFSSSYRSANRILPVYVVSFFREDGIRLFIDTGADRLVTAIDDRKALFDAFFAAAHTWSFLNGTPVLQHLLLGSLSLLCFMTSVSGFYVYNILKKRRQKKISLAKKTHRVMGNLFVFTTLLFSFSGAWHSLQKLTITTKAPNAAEARIDSSVNIDAVAIVRSLDTSYTLNGIGVVKMDDEDYLQLSVTRNGICGKIYLDRNNAALKNGESKYAAFVARTYFPELRRQPLLSVKTLNSFDHSYSMMNKRLPAVKLCYPDGRDVFIETSTSTLAATTRKGEAAEKFSFTNLHMAHYWEMWLPKPFGKAARSSFLILSTLGLLLLSITGLCMYLYKKRK